MKRALFAAVLALAHGAAHAKPPSKPRPHAAAPAKPAAPPLAALPTIARVRIEAARDRLVVLEDVHLPRGEWDKGDLDLYVAFGAPGAPRAFDARLLPLPQGQLEADADAVGDAIPIERAPHRPPSAQVLVGKPQMSGAILHVADAAFRKALAASDIAVIRVRSLLDLPAEDPRAGREIVVRLGVPGDLPLTLGRVQLVSLEPRAWITRAEAQLCGADADPLPLTIAVSPPIDGAPSRATTINPRMALRHESDDLCVRFWAK
jgi:hypothetical protein